MFSKSVCTTVILLALSACGGSTQLSFNELTTRAIQLDDSYGESVLGASGYTAFSNVQANGRSTYSGVIGFGDVGIRSVDDVLVVGEMEVVADFSSDSISGSADNFYVSSNGEAMNGTIEVDMSFDRNTDLTQFYGVDGDLTGRLAFVESGVTIDINMDVDADFLGSNADAIGGYAEGTMDFSSQAGASPAEAVFVVER